VAKDVGVSDVPGVVACIICGCPIQWLERGTVQKLKPTLANGMREHTRVVHPEYTIEPE
jgi:hypothetical protein